MGSPIKLLSKGAAPSMIDTATANEVISKVNALLGTIVSPAGFGKYVIGDKEIKLDLGPLAQIIANLQKSAGTIIGTTAGGGGGGGGGGSVLLPFTIQQINTTTINVRYGTVMDIPPTNVGDNADVTAITTGGTVTVYIDNTLDASGVVTASSLEASSGSLPTSDDTHAYLLVGTVVVAGSVITTINQSLYFSQGFSCCGRDPGDPETTPGIYEFFVR